MKLDDCKELTGEVYLVQAGLFSLKPPQRCLRENIGTEYFCTAMILTRSNYTDAYKTVCAQITEKLQ